MDVKEAVKKAIEYTIEMVDVVDPKRGQDFLSSSDVAVEETRFDEADHHWFITIGYVNPWDRANPGALVALPGTVGARDRRTLKIVEIDDATGQVLSFQGR